MKREFHVRFSEGLGLKYPGLLDTAIPQLLRTLDVAGCIVTIDAMGTQTAIADEIRERGADYVLCVKDNHPKLLDSILLAQAGVGGALQASSSWESHNTGHGREEWRRCWAFSADYRLYKGDQWRGLHSFALVERTRRIGDRTSVERRYYIGSLAPDAEKFMRTVRSHWEVENRLHWCLDVQFGDDYARARTGHVAHNLALVRHIALNLIRLNTSVKTSIKTKRLLAATSDEFRAALLLLGLAVEPETDGDEEED